MKLKKSTIFALWAAVIISFVVTIILLFLGSFYHETISTRLLSSMVVIVFVFVFVFSRFQVERFIYRRIQKIYAKTKIFTEYNDIKSIVNSDIEDLSDKIEQFASTKHTEITELKARENYRKEFLGNVSHELKTPIFTIQGYIETLLDGALYDENVREKYLIRARKGVERLSFIVQDLAMISQLENEELTLNKKAFDIIETIQNVLDSLEIKATQKKIALGFNKTYDIPIFVFADEERVEQVLQNLINNAINYTNINTPVIVSIHYHDKHKILIAIKDEGDGISAKNQERLFERFYRVDKSRSRDQGGTGLGLSIVKHIIEAHNEQVFVESELGKGATFSFTLQTV